MRIFETEIKHRAYDDMWMLMARVPDYENSYRHRNEENRMVTWTPDMWIIIDVKSDKNHLRLHKKGKTSNE